MANTNSVRQVRPKLWDVAPLQAYICWCFSIVNISLGLGMFFLYKTTVAPIAVANLLSYQQWGVVYFSLGVFTMISLLKNNWNNTRQSQLGGLLVKLIWAIALILRCIQVPQTILITLVWIFLVAVQAGLYVFFMPRVNLHAQ